MTSCRVSNQGDPNVSSESICGGEICQIDSLLDLFNELKNKEKKRANFHKKQAGCSSIYTRVAESTQSPERALKYLSKAIHHLATPELYTKRCIIHLRMENYLLAASDAVCAIGMDPSFPSGYWCGAAASIQIEAYCNALQYLSKLRDLLPNSKHCNNIFVKSRNEFMTSGKILPLGVPDDITKNPIDEPFSVFVESEMSALRSDLSSLGVLEASKLNEKFVKSVIETYKRGLFHLPQKYVFFLLENTLALLKDQPNIVSVEVGKKQKATVVGDLLGNFFNLMSIFRLNRSPQLGRPYIFNGNVIGNDKMSLPCMVVLLCMKLLFPEDVHIARGSEECIEMCELNGFQDEVVTVYDENTMKGFTEVFNWLPIAHVVNNAVLVVHGGVFQDEKLSLSDIQEMKRCYQPPDFGPMCDILHSEPWNTKGFGKKEYRSGIWFGPDVTENFCNLNCIDFMITSHHRAGPLGVKIQTGHRCVTLNSSTQYATFIVIEGKTATYKTFHARKVKTIPKDCQCFLVCKCSVHEVEEEQTLQSNYVTLDLTLPPVPSNLDTISSSTVQEKVSSTSTMELVSSTENHSKVHHASDSSFRRASDEFIMESRLENDATGGDVKANAFISRRSDDGQEDSLNSEGNISFRSNHYPEESPLSSSQESNVSGTNPQAMRLSEISMNPIGPEKQQAVSETIDAVTSDSSHSLKSLLSPRIDDDYNNTNLPSEFGPIKADSFIEYEVNEELSDSLTQVLKNNIEESSTSVFPSVADTR